MGNSYCLSTDKKSLQNDQTINVQICEEYIEEKKLPQMTNIDITNKNINTTDDHSNNTGKNHLNNVSNYSKLIMSNNISKNKNNQKKKMKLKMRIIQNQKIMII